METDGWTYIYTDIQTDIHGTCIQTDRQTDEQTSCFIIFQSAMARVAVSSIEQQYGANLLQPPDTNYKKLKIFIDGI